MKGLAAQSAAALPAQPCTLGLDHPAAAELGPLACLGARWSPRVFTLTETSEGCDDLLTQELFCAPCQKLISGGGGILLKRFGELLKTTG